MSEVGNITPLPEDPTQWEVNVPYTFKGLSIVIEYLKGDTRTKVKGAGVIVKGVMPSAYGFILRTTDQHGEEIDMYLADEPHEGAQIYVIDQVNPGNGEFDEHKIMLGFMSAQAAVDNYIKVFSDGSGKKRLGAITTFPGDTFQQWIASQGYSLQPAANYEVSGVVTTKVSGINSTKPQTPYVPKPIDESGGVIVSLPDLSKGPKLIINPGVEGGLEYTLFLFCALDTVIWANAVDTLCRTLDLASEKDVFKIRIASPGGCVFTMGRVCSAIKTTKAKVITYAQGCVASAATTIWAAGHERHILPGAYFMQHMSSQLLQGKSTDIVAKGVFCVEYIKRQLQPLVNIGLFTEQEVNDMTEKSADIFVSGRDAKARIATVEASAVEEA